MERTAWTDERIGDLSKKMDERFDGVDRNFARVDADIRGLRKEIGGLRADNQAQFRGQRAENQAQFGNVREELGGLRAENQDQFTALLRDIGALRMTMIRMTAAVGGGIMTGFLGVIAAIIARGV